MIDVHPDDLLGAVKYQSEWLFFVGTVAEWIMDYSAYDPWFNPEKSDVIFRNNLLVIDEGNIEAFLNAMKPYSLSKEDIKILIDRDGPITWKVVILINFDNKTYINGFREIDIHKYIPPGWIGYEGDPMNYIPDDIKCIWNVQSID